MFQALLLAASLGWNVVAAEGVANGTSSYGTYNIHHHPQRPANLTPSPAPPNPASISRSLSLAYPSVSIVTQSGVILYSPITTNAAPTDQPYPHHSQPHPGPEQPWHSHGGPPGPGQHTEGPPTNWHTPAQSTQSTQSLSPGSSGGLLIDTAPAPTAIRTYFVNGNPVAPGTPTVVGGTTYSIAASGTSLYVNGKPSEASHAIIGGGASTRTTLAAAASSSSTSMEASTNGAEKCLESSLAVVLGAVGLVVGYVV